MSPKTESFRNAITTTFGSTSGDMIAIVDNSQSILVS